MTPQKYAEQPNFDVKLMRPGFGPAAELPTVTPASWRLRHTEPAARLSPRTLVRPHAGVGTSCKSCVREIVDGDRCLIDQELPQGSSWTAVPEFPVVALAAARHFGHSRRSSRSGSTITSKKQSSKSAMLPRRAISRAMLRALLLIVSPQHERPSERPRTQDFYGA